MVANRLSTGEHIVLGVVSLFLGTLLWLNVTAKQEPGKQREFLVPVVVRGLSPELVPTSLPEGITLVATGSELEFERLDSSQLSAEIDLTGLKSGKHSVRIKAPSSRPGMALAPKRPMVLVELEELRTSSRQVEVVPIGLVSSGIRFLGAVSEPRVVALSGPASALKKAVKVRAMLDLSMVKPGVSNQVPLEALDREGIPVPLVRCEPRSVTILPAIEAELIENQVRVRPTLSGDVADGYAIESVTIEPEKISLTGSASDLAKITSISTQPIEIGGLKNEKNFTIGLVLPAGLAVKGESTVVVKLKVVKNQP